MERLTSKQIIHDEATGKDFEQRYIFGHKWGPAFFKRGSDDYEEYSKLLDRLAAFEDTGLEPEEINAALSIKAWDDAVEDGYHKAIMELKEYHDLGDIDHLRDLIAAEKDGRLVVLPFIAMVEQSLQDGKMTPQKDQIFNGRYAVVYIDKKKWNAPLIDICGTAYNLEQSKNRMDEITRKAAESAPRGEEQGEYQ